MYDALMTVWRSSSALPAHSYSVAHTGGYSYSHGDTSAYSDRASAARLLQRELRWGDGPRLARGMGRE